MNIKPKPNAIYGYCSKTGISRDELSRRMKVATTTTYRIDAGLVTPSTRFIASLLTVTGGKFEDYFELTEAAA